MNKLNDAHRVRLSLLRTALGTTAVAAAAGLALPLAAAAAVDAPAPHYQGKVSYVSGGVGASEAREMKQLAAKYPLEVEFIKKEANKHAAYLAGDAVTIRDVKHRTLLDTTSDGPFLLAKLPPGTYVITAADKGVSKTRSVDVAAGKHQRVVFEW